MNTLDDEKIKLQRRLFVSICEGNYNGCLAAINAGADIDSPVKSQIITPKENGEMLTQYDGFTKLTMKQIAEQFNRPEIIELIEKHMNKDNKRP